MSDLRRWSEEGATAEELSLLEVARRRQAAPAQRAAVMAALGVGVATTAAGATGATGVAGLLTKLASIALFASIGVGVALWRGSAEKPGPVTSAATVASVLPAVTPSARPEPSAAPPEPTEAPSDPAPKVVAKPKPAAPAAVASSSLSQELKVLKQAHDALAHGNPNGALAALDDYHAHFPQGALGAEETVIRVQALLARGDRARAASVAHQFSSTHPDSLYAQRVERLVSEVK